MTRALFLDRDGTLTVDVGYPRDPALVEPIPGAIEALRELQQTWKLVIVSNQSGIARGLITQAEASAVHARVVEVFAEAGVTFAGAYYCPHAVGAGCRCRKPAPGMLLDAAADHAIDLEVSAMIGDRQSDLDAGRNAGVTTLVMFESWSQVLEHLG